MLKVLVIIISIFPQFVLSTQCQLCDSFSGYCDFDGRVCVGPKCSRRFAPTSSGLIREQRLCVPSDSELGCRKAILWDGIEGKECVCDSHMCNSTNHLYFSITTFLIFSYYMHFS